MADRDRDILLQYKGDRCCHCGKTVEEFRYRFGTVSTFQFNHIDPSKKDPNYKNIIRRSISPIVLDEVDKCVLLCNECHTILHNQGGTASCTITYEFEGRKYSQTFNGQVMWERDERGQLAFNMFADGTSLLTPYRVYVGDGRPETLFAGELEEGRRLSQLIQGTRNGAPFVIRSIDGREMFRAKRLNDKQFRITISDQFPLVKAELIYANGRALWVRNGVSINREHGVRRDVIYSITVNYDPNLE